MFICHVVYNMLHRLYFGGENINKIPVIALIILAVGLAGVGFALLSGDDSGQLINNPVSNEVSSNSNMSLDNNTGIAEDSSSDNIQDVVKEISSKNNRKDISQGYPVPLNNSSSAVDTPVYSVAAYGASDISVYNQYPDYSSNINKSEYVLSPYYTEHIFVKAGEDFTDKYGFCVADGYFIPLGNITNPIENIRICNLSCGIADCYFNLSRKNIYGYDNVTCYLEHGVFDASQIPQNTPINKSEYVLSPNYAKHIYIRAGEDFTDKYALCAADGNFIPLGNITNPIDNIRICNQSCGIGDCYFDSSGSNVYDYDDVSYYLKNGGFESDEEIQQDNQIYFDDAIYGEITVDTSNNVS